MSSTVTVPLASVTSWSSGGTPNRANPAYWGGAIPWISAATLKSTRIHDSDQHLTEAGVRAGSKLAPAGATLVLVRGMALHRETRIGMATRPVSFNQDVKALMPKSTLLPEFLVYALQARSTQILDLVSSAGSGTGVLNTQLLQRLPIWVPDTQSQRAIVDAISAADGTATMLNRLIAKKRSIKQGAMQQLLTGRTRLPGFKDPWPTMKVGEIASVGRGASPRPIASTRWFSDSSNVGWVRIADLARSDGLTLNKTTQRLSKDGIARSRFLPTGTLILSIAATVGLPIVTGFPTCIHDGFVAIQNLRGVDQTFLLYVLKGLQDDLLSAGQTGSQANVNTNIVKNLLIPVPSIAEQRQIAAALWDLDSEIACMQSRLTKARAIKTGMMEALLTGEARISVEVAS